MNLVIAADPSAFQLKQNIKMHLEQRGHVMSDVGTTENRDVTFYDAAQNACAGKQSGIFAACVESVFAARMCRAINNANVLCLGSMIWGEAMAKEAADVFLETAHTQGLPGIKDALVQSAREVSGIDERTRRE
jgi:ribose 5-phosphate isomerase B